MLCDVNQSRGETQSCKHYISFGDIEVPPIPNNISHIVGELDPRENEKEKRGGPIEELEFVKFDD